MIKAFVVLAAAAASLVAASDRVSVKGYTADSKGALDCKFGSGDILKKCGTCAKSITECATSNPNKTKQVVATSPRSLVTAVAALSTFSNACKQGSKLDNMSLMNL